MLRKASLIFALLSASALWAADQFTPLEIKAGEWETTMTTQMNGIPPVPPEVLSRVTPEQRANMEAASKSRAFQAPRTSVRKLCLKKEDIEKPLTFESDQKALATILAKCHATVSSPRIREEIRFDCSETAAKSTGTMRMEALNSENVRITTQSSSTDGTRTMNVISNGSAKWLGGTCVEVR